MKKRIYALMLTFIMATTILLSSCAGGQNDDIVERWKMTDISGWGVESEGRELREGLISGELSLEYRFFRDGRVSVTVVDRFGTDVSWSDWSTENGIMRVTDVDYYYHIEGSQLTLTYSTLGRHDTNFHFQRIE